MSRDIDRIAIAASLPVTFCEQIATSRASKTSPDAPNRRPIDRRCSPSSRGCSGANSSGRSPRPIHRSIRSSTQSDPSPQARPWTPERSRRTCSVVGPAGVRMGRYQPSAEWRAHTPDIDRSVARRSSGTSTLIVLVFTCRTVDASPCCGDATAAGRSESNDKSHSSTVVQPRRKIWRGVEVAPCFRPPLRLRLRRLRPGHPARCS